MESMMESFLVMCIEALHKHGSVIPLAFMMHGENLITVLMELSDKESAVQALRKICQENKVEEAIFMCEAYVSRDLSVISLNKAADRQEAIIVQGEDTNGKSCAIIQPFHRTKKGEILLEKTKKHLSSSPFFLISGILTKQVH